MQDQLPRQSNDFATNSKATLPSIPDKIYFTISEVGELCRLKPHVLRYWEEEFSQLNPAKRKGNRRYYLREDIILIRKIKNLLYEQGFTIEGAKNKLANEKSNHSQTKDVVVEFISSLISDLKTVLLELK